MAEAAEERAEEWKEDAINAREEAMVDVDEATEAMNDAVYAEMLARRREERAKAALENVDLTSIPASRTEEEWIRLSRAARYKAAQRVRDYLMDLFTTHNFRMEDLSAVLGRLTLLNKLMDSPSMFAVYNARVEELRVKQECDDYGIEFALVLHYDFLMRPERILQMAQVGCKQYNRESHSYKSKALLTHPYLKDTFVKVPRIAPQLSKILPVIKDIETRLSIAVEENGRIGYKYFFDVVQMMAM